LALTPFVLGADLLGPIFQNFKGTNLGQTYINYAPFIDAIIYIWLFISVAKGALKDKLSNQVAVALGLILGIAMCVFELTSKFNIGKLGPFAAIILFLIIGMFLFNLMKGFTGNTWAAVSVAFLIIYSLANWIAPSLITWMQQTGWLGTLLSILFLISIIGLIYGVFSLFKGIKGGEWGAFRAGKREDEAERKFTRSNRKEEIEANRQKKAAENMFKLETEMGNLNHNIQQLEQAEATSFNNTLRTRQQQIQAVADLSNVLNRSWELQKELQEAYGKASQEAYANNEGYLNTIKQSTQQLDDFLKRIAELLQKLHDGVVNTEKEEREADVQIRTELDKQIQELDTSVKKYEDTILTIGTYTDIKEKKTNDTVADLKTIEDIAKQRKDILIKIRETQALLEKNRNEILLGDQKNITNLKHAIEVSDQNPAKNLNVLVRGINVGQNASQIGKDYDAAKGFFGTVGSLINLRNQYLSGDNLKQIYQSIKNVHTTLQEIVTKTNEEKTLITNKNNLLTQFNDLQAVLQKKKTDIIKTHLTNSKQIFERDIAQLKSFQDNITKYYVSSSSPIAMGINIGGAYKKEFQNIADIITDVALKELLIQQTKNINYILGRYNNIQLSDKGLNSIIEKTIKELDIIVKKLSEDIAAFELRYKHYREIIDIESKLAQATNANTQTQSRTSPKLTP